MSLDVWLKVEQGIPNEPKIYIREDGRTREISRAEWNERYPGRKPYVIEESSINVFEYNITHNLGKMAKEAGLYEALWRPGENGYEIAAQLIDVLSAGLYRLESNPEWFKTFNPPNEWGNYEGLVAFVRAYLEACSKYPNATIHAWR